MYSENLGYQNKNRRKKTMSDFNKAVEKVLKFEGVLSNDKYDAGGLTSTEYRKECIQVLILLI